MKYRELGLEYWVSVGRAKELWLGKGSSCVNEGLDPARTHLYRLKGFFQVQAFSVAGFKLFVFIVLA